MTRHVPVLPESAPFTAEQRAYLNGFLAGLFSFAPVPAPASSASLSAAPAPPSLVPLTILFASQTGNAERLAKRIARDAARRGFAPAAHDLAQYPVAQLGAERAVLLVASTFGDGEPPDGAKGFWAALQREEAPRLAQTRFSVCALGDSNYPRFCQFGKDLDGRLEALGAARVHPRQDCDVEFERPFQDWLDKALTALASAPAPGAPSFEARTAHPVRAGDGLMHTSAGPAPRWSGLETRPGHGIPAADDPVPSWSRSQPYPARLKTNRRLSAAASAKDVRHFEIDLGESGIRYEPGDALGVWPTQCPALVDRVLAVLGCDGEEAVPGRDGETVSLRLALTRHYELGRLTPALLGYAAERAPDPELLGAASPAANGERQSYLEGRDVLDLLEAHPTVRPAPGEFVALLRKLQPRLYSISSSPRAHPDEVHLTVGAVRYTVRERERKGMASCFLADRAEPDTPVPVYLHANPAFRPPGPEVPLILIGPGTGIAPFRAFLQDREALGARGRNWLFFGDQRESTDFLYREELEAFLKSGRLNRLDLAWSRDAAAKVYVQHRMREAAAELWRWLEDGAAVYVCGDASRMARDVDAALHEVIQLGGGRTADQAREYVAALQSRKRYQRDVY